MIPSALLPDPVQSAEQAAVRAALLTQENALANAVDRLHAAIAQLPPIHGGRWRGQAHAGYVRLSGDLESRLRHAAAALGRAHAAARSAAWLMAAHG